MGMLCQCHMEQAWMQPNGKEDERNREKTCTRRPTPKTLY